MNLELAQRLDFISSLDLPSESGAYMRHVLRLAENPRTAYIDAGSAISFVAGVSQQSQSDCLNSTLLAQLAANRQYDREKDTVNWYNFYKTVLENVGWAIQNFTFLKYNASGASFTMDQVVLDLIAAIATQDEIAALQATISAMRALSNGDGRLVLFESSSHSASQGNFQIATANEYGGALSMRVAASYFSTQQSVTNVLWFSFSSSSTSLYNGAQTMTLDKQVYQQVRQAIIQKLGDNARNFVKNLPI